MTKVGADVTGYVFSLKCPDSLPEKKYFCVGDHHTCHVDVANVPVLKRSHVRDAMANNFIYACTAALGKLKFGRALLSDSLLRPKEPQKIRKGKINFPKSLRFYGRNL